MAPAVYETFSVLSGVTMLGAAALPRLTGGERALLGLSGAFFLIYGIYVSAQSTGTYDFPVQIFLLPFFIVGWAAIRLFGKQATGPVTPPAPHPPAADGTGAMGRAGVGKFRCNNDGCGAFGHRTSMPGCGRCGRANERIA